MSIPELLTKAAGNQLHGKVRYFFAPGRINLIGEHIDYNGGLVFPAAIERGIYAAVKRRDDNIVKLQSLNINSVKEVNLSSEIVKEGKSWYNYPSAIMKYLKEGTHNLGGLEIIYYGDLPEEAGLSSSAAIEVLTAYIFNEIFELGISRTEIALMGKRVENDFIGVNSGIMDQFSIAHGKADNALLLDCSTLKFEYIPLNLQDSSLVIINTKTKRELAGSKYNDRRKECEEALNEINKASRKSTRCLVNAEIKDAENYLSGVLLKRAQHVITEQQRVKKAASALSEKDLSRFGKLMTESHISLKNNYEVTGEALDTVVNSALSVEGVLGARMTGAGFGGCAIALVRNESIEKLKEKVTVDYSAKCNIKPEVYVTKAGDGVRELT